MITYPSTHGIYEENIELIIQLVHQQGGLVYMDGANMNAQIGWTSPSCINVDICHLNLHKTFCIPHGGGGPGMGPVGVRKEFIPFLPTTNINHILSSIDSTFQVSSAPFSSACLLPITYAYIHLMGKEGLKSTSFQAILNANYLKKRLQEAYPILYRGTNQLCAHEFIIDIRPIHKATGIDCFDISKRLMDYGFHAPTVSFPITGTLMIEPTESEDKNELDRFCNSMLAIRDEIKQIELGVMDKTNNPLKNAPHTQDILTSSYWDYPYSREKAGFPLPHLRNYKYWPPISRINDAEGDRNLICTCS